MDDPVANARLLSLTIERFKSYKEATTIDLAPLTVILGRNNSGKSSIIQALLLLKQTLALPRPEVPLHLEGYVDALNLRELTYGRPAAGPKVPGPRIGIRWSSQRIHKAKTVTVLDRSMELLLDYVEENGRIVLEEVKLTGSSPERPDKFSFDLVVRRQSDGSYRILSGWPDDAPPGVTIPRVEFDHFLPYLVAPWDSREKLFPLGYPTGPLDDLRTLLSEFTYLGAARAAPQGLYRFATVAPNDLGASGEYAAQLLQARKADPVHYPMPLRVEGYDVHVPSEVRARPLSAAINDVFGALGVGASLEIDERDVGFRLLFERSSLQHVGRGVSYLLPVVELGLLADPLRFKPDLGDAPIHEYEAACPHHTHCALEEPEAHLHPKVQTRLAHWLVALAMARRQLLIETHSDHLVRRLRGLVARAKPGSELETWLLDNVRVLHVEQEPDGQSFVRSEKLTPQGSLEEWPADFMDEATDEERAIYDASLDKPAAPPSSPPEVGEVEHDVGEEPDVES
jgi:predicted ATPase